MATHALFGHRDTRTRLARAQREGRLPQVLLITGEPGVGKQRLALWLAQLVLCLEPGDEPCGRCRNCARVLTLAHPDLHWVVPVPRGKATDPDKQVEEIRETLAELMEARRKQPVYDPPDGMALHGVATARLLLRLSSLTTVEGGKRAIIIGDADRLVPQEASSEAANALLKFLEEPPASSLIMMTTTDATPVLPTIRSRATPIRLGRLDEAELRTGLEALRPALGAAERAALIDAAEGSLGRALTSAAGQRMDGAVNELLAACRTGGAGRFERVLKQGPWAARGEFAALLDGLTTTLGEAARCRSGAAPRAPLPEALSDVDDPRRMLAAMEKVDGAREAVQRNVNPQLLLGTLTLDLREALWA